MNGKISVDQAENHRAVVIEQGQGRVNQAELLQQRVEQAGVAQQEHPGVGANQKAGPERQHHQAEIEVLAPAGARDEQREREAEQQTERSGRARDPERAPEDGEIDGIDQALVTFRGPGRGDAAVDAARQEAVAEDDGERREKQRDASTVQEGARNHARRRFIRIAARRPVPTTDGRLHRARRWRRGAKPPRRRARHRPSEHRRGRSCRETWNERRWRGASDGRCAMARAMRMASGRTPTSPIQLTAPRNDATNRVLGVR